jgi:hypothetical protein
MDRGERGEERRRRDHPITRNARDELRRIANVTTTVRCVCAAGKGDQRRGSDDEDRKA